MLRRRPGRRCDVRSNTLKRLSLLVVGGRHRGMVTNLGQVYLMKIVLHQQIMVLQPLDRSMTNGTLHLLRNLCVSWRHVTHGPDRGGRRPRIRDLRATQVQAMSRYLSVEV